jgi:hypothetical protein
VNPTVVDVVEVGHALVVRKTIIDLHALLVNLVGNLT